MTRKCLPVLPLPLAWLLAVGVIFTAQDRASGDLVSQLFSFHVITTGITEEAVNDVEENIFMRVSNATALRAPVLDPGEYAGGSNDSQALFEFFVLAGARESISIAEIYFEDGVLLVDDDPVSPDFMPDPADEVSFEEGAIPARLPGGMDIVSPQFKLDHYIYTADAENPSPYWGINPGEILGVSFLLQNDLELFDLNDDDLVDIHDVLAALETGVNNPQPGTGNSIRVGIHVQGLADDQSGKEQSASAIAVPEPVAAVRLVAMLAAVMGVLSIRRGVRRGAPS